MARHRLLFIIYEEDGKVVGVFCERGGIFEVRVNGTLGEGRCPYCGAHVKVRFPVYPVILEDEEGGEAR